MIGSDNHGEDYRAREVTFGVRGLAAKLHRLFEAQQREHDSGRQGQQDRLDRIIRVREEATRGVPEVLAVETVDHQHDDRQDRDDDFPPSRGVVDARQPADADHVDDHEDQHQDDRGDDPRPAKRALSWSCTSRAQSWRGRGTGWRPAPRLGRRLPPADRTSSRTLRLRSCRTRSAGSGWFPH